MVARVEKRLNVSFDQMAAPVPEIVDGTLSTLCRTTHAAEGSDV
jgi:hypothetical protein